MTRECGVKHEQPVGDRVKGIVYEAPVAFCLRYVERTARSLTERMTSIHEMFELKRHNLYWYAK